MPTLQPLVDSTEDLKAQHEARVQLIGEIERTTSRPLIVYAANLERGGLGQTSINDSDITSFSDLIEDLPKGNGLDVVVHSPGGSAEATERLVNLLRANYNHVRFIVPHSAYSAATMFALSGDEVMMDDRSSLGPIDPQLVMVIRTPQGVIQQVVAAEDILSGFERVRELIEKGGTKVLPAFLPMLNKLDLHLFEQCENAIELSETLVQKWLETYMLKKLPKPQRKTTASKITKALSSHALTLSHARTVSIADAQKLGLVIMDLRKDPTLRTLVWKLYCRYEHYLQGTGAAKIFENGHGVNIARNVPQQVQVQLPFPFPMPPGTPPPPPALPQQN